MRKKTLIAIIIISVIVVGVIFYNYFKKPSMEVSVEPETSEKVEGQKNVLVENFKYSPKEMTISAGETVVWKNKDSVKHNVVSSNGNELSSDLLSEDETYSHTFNTIGEYPYYCVPHPYMIGKIIVQ